MSKPDIRIYEYFRTPTLPTTRGGRTPRRLPHPARLAATV